jgi:hypothetical protein
MARGDPLSMSRFENANALLFAAWKHGARHVVIRANGEGTELHFLGPDGSEHRETVSLPYQSTAQRIRTMAARLGRVLANMDGQRWVLDVSGLKHQRRDQLFFHMHAAE